MAINNPQYGVAVHQEEKSEEGLKKCNEKKITGTDVDFETINNQIDIKIPSR